MILTNLLCKLHSAAPDILTTTGAGYVVFAPETRLYHVPECHHHHQEPLQAQAEEGHPELDRGLALTSSEIFPDVETFGEEHGEEVDGAEEKPEKMDDDAAKVEM